MMLDIFSPCSIGTITIKNRLIMPAIGTGFAGVNGEITDTLCKFYKLRAEGGIGAIITESIAVRKDGKLLPRNLLLSDDAHKEKLKTLNDLVHKADCKIFYQLAHAGRAALSMAIGGRIPVSPSGIPCPVVKQRTRALEEEEIRQLEDCFAMVAADVRASGADGVEIHMAHGYLVCQFLSAYSNKRMDNYGGDLTNRCRFAVNIVKKIREKTGPGFPVICRLSADEFVKDGLDIQQTITIAKLLEQAGASAIHVSACNYESSHLNIPNYYREDACFVEFAQTVKRHISLPVIGVGKLKEKSLIEKYLTGKSFDFAAIGRPLLADPQLPLKWKKGDIKDVRPCLSCNNCFSSIADGSLECSINPRLYGDTDKKAGNGMENRQLVIIGGGVSGCNAALYAAEAGINDITLYEKHPFLGGQLKVASSLSEKKYSFSRYLTFLENKLHDAGVKVQVNYEIDETKLTEILTNSNAIVIIATGIHFDRIRREYALPGLIDYTDADALKTIKDKNVIIIGGGAVGLELTDLLLNQHNRVTLLEKRPRVGSDLPGSIKFFLINKVTINENLEIVVKCKIEKIDEQRVVYKTRNAETIEVKYDYIIFAHKRDNNDILFLLGKKIREKDLYLVGDADVPGKLKDALQSVYKAVQHMINSVGYAPTTQI
ncbi:MAG: FAD-dependent oxidoreductase [Spirochaetales bacterium]|nr:FAD-dependent oxidoreductase [Spirochaetales bacterium]